ncbi:biotin transporter BioY [Corynebacterium sp. sy039]|uniref:biotin transporter BioY n=1 Tax=Corynebacterium sp. sy039 TaxID=2599641 RepID=UPI0011B75CC0|nr:biotin transporter BioY [Corynebacterium sp. sy039]QDZ43560.1 biotin transporter BioY [Corynebacterium sp. sy039]
MSDIAYVAVFAALIIVLAFVAIPVGTAGVPIVMQNAAIILTGLVLGPRRGLLATCLFLGIGLVGLPVFPGGRSTLVALAGPTVGYIIGYLVSSFVAGLIAYQAPRKSKAAHSLVLVIAAILALGCQYLCGAAGLSVRAGMEFSAALTAQIPFIIPDLIKITAAVLITLSIHTAFPQLRPAKS